MDKSLLVTAKEEKKIKNKNSKVAVSNSDVMFFEFLVLSYFLIPTYEIKKLSVYLKVAVTNSDFFSSFAVTNSDFGVFIFLFLFSSFAVTNSDLSRG